MKKIASAAGPKGEPTAPPGATYPGNRHRGRELILDGGAHELLTEETVIGEAEPRDPEPPVQRPCVQRAQGAIQAHGSALKGEVIRAPSEVARPVDSQARQRTRGALSELVAGVVLELGGVELPLQPVAEQGGRDRSASPHGTVQAHEADQLVSRWFGSMGDA